MKFASVCVLLCIGICGSLTSGKSVLQVQGDQDWSYLILSQFWPASSCIYFEEKKDECYIPPKVKGWTIHGLWPSRPDSTEYPNNCHPSMVFNMTQIKVLRPRLDLQWHYYDKDGDPTYLWNHEWIKHGTCAVTLPDLRGELKYFNKTLDLHSHVNLTEALAKSGVLPSKTDTYKRDMFFNAVMKYYSFKPYIVCDYDREERKAYIDQIYLCYSKTFEQQDCYPTPSMSRDGSPSKTDPPSYYNKCEESDDIYYLPFNDNEGKTNHHRNQDNSLVFRSENAKH